MRSACLVRTRFILNNFSGIGLGGPRTPRTPLGYAPDSALLRKYAILLNLQRTERSCVNFCSDIKIFVAIHEFNTNNIVHTLIYVN